MLIPGEMMVAIILADELCAHACVDSIQRIGAASSLLRMLANITSSMIVFRHECISTGICRTELVAFGFGYIIRYTQSRNRHRNDIEHIMIRL